MIDITINGVTHAITVSPDTPLLWVLREHLNLTGTRYGCGAGLCGACTVHIDGKAVRACTTAVSEAGGRQITTIEGLTSPVGRALQGAWEKHAVPQCGYCQSGQLMQAAALLSQNPKPGRKEIVAAMDGNLCRCGTYLRIQAAIAEASASLGVSQ